MRRPWLVTYDFSTQADAVLNAAAEELHASQGSMILLHVYHVPPPPSTFSAIGSEMTYATSVELGEALKSNAQKHLEGVAEDLKERFPQMTVEVVVREGDAVDEILATVDEKNAGRIVVGTHGRRGVERFFLGSVAERIVRLAHVSVLVVKTPYERASP
jgi:nucleotide-binding universal stress UspA family protein